MPHRFGKGFGIDDAHRNELMYVRLKLLDDASEQAGVRPHISAGLGGCRHAVP